MALPPRIQVNGDRNSSYQYAQTPLIRTTFLHDSALPNHSVLLDSSESPSQANNHFLRDGALYQNQSENPTSSQYELKPRSIIKCDNEKVKKKRSRVSAEQLDRLEHYFATDTNPTSARRCEISLSLGMQERQTQVWFQNRRAKARLQEAKRKQSKSVSPSCTPLVGDRELRDVILEDAPVIVVPCTDIIIGSWRRTANSENKNGLIVYMCEEKQSVCWFIRSGRSFKMEIPYKIITDATFTRSSPNEGIAILVLSEPPVFFLDEEVKEGSPSRKWARCPDWTQRHEASRILSHQLIGLANPLFKIIQKIRAFNHLTSLATVAKNDIALYSQVPSTAQHEDAYFDSKPRQSIPLPVTPDVDRNNVYLHHFQGTEGNPNSLQAIIHLPNSTLPMTHFHSAPNGDYCEVPISVSHNPFPPQVSRQATQPTSRPLSWSCDLFGPGSDQTPSTSFNYINVPLTRQPPALSTQTYLWP